MNKSSLIVYVVIALLGIFVGLYYAKNADDKLAAYRAEHDVNMQGIVNMGMEKQSHVHTPVHTTMVQNTDSLDWLLALTENTSSAYRQYIEQHADGLHADEAREILTMIASTRERRIAVQQNDSVEHLAEEPDTIS